MKRQRNTQQVKEQDKCPPNQTKEEEIGNLPDKEFLCLFILFKLLSLGCPFCILAVCGVLFIWRFLTVCGFVQVACQGLKDF